MFRRVIKIYYYKIMTFFYGLIHPIEKKVFFISFFGKQYSDNPKAVSERMHELYPEYKQVWLFKPEVIDSIEVPEYIQPVVVSRKNLIRQRATSAAFVTNEDLGPDIYKKKNQFMVQTWHGDRGFKKILYEDTGLQQSYDISDNRITNIAVAGSRRYYGEEMYRKAFRYDGDILLVGSPRNDRLVNGISNEEVNKIKEKIGVDLETKILLYAPTFRDGSKEKQCISINIGRVLEQLSKNGDKWVCLLRAHVGSMGLTGMISNDCIDVTCYSDMTDLLLVSDFLITDYSSCCNDFALTGRPVVLAIYDVDEYEKKCRGFKVRPEDVGFFIAKNDEELIDIINNASKEEYEQKDRLALEYYDTCETGHASTSVCNAINEFYKNNHEKK